MRYTLWSIYIDNQCSVRFSWCTVNIYTERVTKFVVLFGNHAQIRQEPHILMDRKIWYCTGVTAKMYIEIILPRYSLATICLDQNILGGIFWHKQIIVKLYWGYSFLQQNCTGGMFWLWIHASKTYPQYICAWWNMFACYTGYTTLLRRLHGWYNVHLHYEKHFQQGTFSFLFSPRANN